MKTTKTTTTSKKKRLPSIKPIRERTKKSTAAELELRVQAVVKMTLQGYSRADIVRYSKQTWLIESRMVDVYLLKAKTAIKEIAAGQKEELTDKAVARFEELYSKAYKNQDWGLCKGIQESINKLMGLNEATKIDNTINVKDFKVTDLIGFK